MSEIGPAAWTPQPGMQQFVSNCDIEDIFIGGGRGCGATDVSIAEWLKHRERYSGDARGLFVTRGTEMLRCIADRMRDIYAGTGFTFRRMAYDFSWPDGARMHLAAVSDTDDVIRLAGNQASFVVFDSANWWGCPDLIDILSRTLAPVHGIPIKRIINGHPMLRDDGYDWLRDRYVKDRTPLVPFEWDDPGSRTGKRTSVYVPANIFSNAKLLEYDPRLVERLQAVGDDRMRAALLYGDWTTGVNDA